MNELLVCRFLGKVVIYGPEEIGIKRNIAVPRGNYWIVAAQQIINDEEEEIHLYFDQVATPQQQSKIIVADRDLSPRIPLIEADIAG
jgi:hypothetical protein